MKIRKIYETREDACEAAEIFGEAMDVAMEQMETVKSVLPNSFKSFVINFASVMAFTLLTPLLIKVGFEDAVLILFVLAAVTVLVSFYKLVMKPLGGLSSLSVLRFNNGGVEGTLRDGASLVMAGAVALAAESSIIGSLFILCVRPIYFLMTFFCSIMFPPTLVLLHMKSAKRDLRFLSKNKRAAEREMYMAS